MEYQGIALHESLPKGRKSGVIQVNDVDIIFLDEGKRLQSFPINRTEISQGGTGNRYVYLKHPDKSGWTFYTDDKSILKHAGFSREDHHKKSAKKIRNNRRLLWISVQSIIGVLLAIVILFYLFRGKIVESVAMSVPVTWEQEVSETMLESATMGKNVVKDEKILSDLEKITFPLVNAVDNKDFKFSFTIVEDPTLNAYALPGGAVVIHSGLILEADDVNEVAGVLAHEISHVTRRHHIRGMVDKLGFFMLLRALIGDIGGIGSELAIYGATIESLKYSRDYELEADESGWNLMLKANLDPRGMIDFFEKLQHEHGDMPGVATFMSTHPATGDRILILEEKPLSGHDFDKINIDFEEFQNDIKIYFEVN